MLCLVACCVGVSNRAVPYPAFSPNKTEAPQLSTETSDLRIRHHDNGFIRSRSNVYRVKDIGSMRASPIDASTIGMFPCARVLQRIDKAQQLSQRCYN
jgi:hypothetical protein